MELTKEELEILVALVANAQTSVKDAPAALELWNKLKNDVKPTKQELEILAALVASAQTSVKDAPAALELWEKLKKMIEKYPAAAVSKDKKSR